MYDRETFFSFLNILYSTLIYCHMKYNFLGVYFQFIWKILKLIFYSFMYILTMIPMQLLLLGVSVGILCVQPAGFLVILGAGVFGTMFQEAVLLFVTLSFLT